MKKQIIKFFLFLASLRIARKHFLFLSAWALSLSFFSCQQKNTDSKKQSDSTVTADSVVTTCYEPVVNDSSNQVKSQKGSRPVQGIVDTVVKKKDIEPPVMCYAPMPPKND